MNDCLKILHCIYSMTVGGAETMLVDIANVQASLGHKVTILIVNDIVDEQLLAKLRPDINIIRMNRRQGDRPLVMMARLNMLIMKMKPDIIHAHHHKFCRLVQVRKCRLVFTVHDVNTEMKYARESRMVAITDTVREDVLKRVPKADIATIFNGIRTGDILSRQSSPFTGSLKIIQVANLLPHKKGQDLLIKALAILGNRGIENVDVSFIGGGDSKELQKLADSLGVAGRVHFLGSRDRSYIYSTLSDYDAMCHPSRYEGFGLTVAEGMAAGLPLILTRGDGPWEVADGGRLCLSAENGDADSLADAIETLMADYPAALARAQEAREYVMRYDISRTVDNYIDYYRRIINFH